MLIPQIVADVGSVTGMLGAGVWDTYQYWGQSFRKEEIIPSLPHLPLRHRKQTQVKDILNPEWFLIRTNGFKVKAVLPDWAKR